MSRLSSSEKWLAATSALLFVSYSVPKWANYPVGEWLASVHGSEDVSALEGDFATTPIAALMTFGLLGAMALKALGVFDAASSVAVAKAYVVAASVAAICVGLALVIGPATMDIGPELEGERGPMLYVGVGLAIAMVVLAHRHLREVQQGATAPTSSPSAPLPPPRTASPAKQLPPPTSRSPLPPPSRPATRPPAPTR